MFLKLKFFFSLHRVCDSLFHPTMFNTFISFTLKFARSVPVENRRRRWRWWPVMEDDDGDGSGDWSRKSERDTPEKVREEQQRLVGGGRMKMNNVSIKANNLIRWITLMV
ncbi:hypothetical protein TSUD_305710 [Trifolium subterraneum]|uniref:Uncharacterized protein n=1 Tax=Trifolium subterraneum TaxID=3900 RepID=A0A2Z6LZP3_TRISU|nr:hypothetical protein TSUD_305710 [Trifolium subterraneum]